MSEKRDLVIHFMDGSKVGFDIPKQVDEGLSIISRMEKVLDKQYIVIEVDGVMQLYPVHNIKSIQFHPVPKRLPEYVIRGAVSVDLNF